MGPLEVNSRTLLGINSDDTLPVLTSLLLQHRFRLLGIQQEHGFCMPVGRFSRKCCHGPECLDGLQCRLSQHQLVQHLGGIPVVCGSNPWDWAFGTNSHLF